MEKDSSDDILEHNINGLIDYLKEKARLARKKKLNKE
jgi:hypothetical protein